MRRWLLAAGLLALVLLGWELASRSGRVSPHLFPPPTAIAAWLGRSLSDGTLGSATLVTLRRLMLGYGLGLALGMPLGMLCARVRAVQDTLGTAALGFQALPSVCWAPLTILWFGLTETAILFVVIMGTVWSILLATQHGIRSVPPIYARAARTMGSRGLHTALRVTLPASLPFVVTGMKQGWAFAWRSLMAAEIYVTILTGFGLGQMLHYGRELHAMDQVFGVMVVIVAVGLAADRALFAPLERSLHRRWGTGALT
ncbi:MAG: ABC transporter permease [Dehalococcoidia bacterium]